MEINERLRALRKELDMTQVEFGQKTGISQGHLTAMEGGKRAITTKTIKSICSICGVREEWFISGTGEMFDKSNPNLLERIAKEYRLTDLEKNIVRIYLELPAPQKESITAFLRNVASLIAKDDPDPVLHAVPKIQLRPSAREGTDITAAITPEQEKSYGERLSELPEDSDF